MYFHYGVTVYGKYIEEKYPKLFFINRPYTVTPQWKHTRFGVTVYGMVYSIHLHVFLVSNIYINGINVIWCNGIR